MKETRPDITNRLAMVQEDDDSFDDSPLDCVSCKSEDTKTNRISDCDTDKQRIQFTSEASKRVNRVRFLVFLVLFVAAIAVVFTVYKVGKNSQQTEIESRYLGISGRVIDAFLSIPNDKIGPLGALRVMYTAQALDNNNTWPFVTLSSFQQRASIVKRLSSGLHVSIFPLVQEKDREQWEEYVPQHQQWM